MSNIKSIKFYLHTADMVRTSQTKWIGVFNRPMTLNRLTEERSPLM
jgi:hypothetical protein